MKTTKQGQAPLSDQWRGAVFYRMECTIGPIMVLNLKKIGAGVPENAPRQSSWGLKGAAGQRAMWAQDSGKE